VDAIDFACLWKIKCLKSRYIDKLQNDYFLSKISLENFPLQQGRRMRFVAIENGSPAKLDATLAFHLAIFVSTDLYLLMSVGVGDIALWWTNVVWMASIEPIPLSPLERPDQSQMAKWTGPHRAHFLIGSRRRLRLLAANRMLAIGRQSQVNAIVEIGRQIVCGHLPSLFPSTNRPHSILDGDADHVPSHWPDCPQSIDHCTGELSKGSTGTSKMSDGCLAR